MKFLGKGTFGQVFKALDPETKEVVAIKRLIVNEQQSSQWASAMKEETILAKLSHPNIVEYLGSIYEDDSISFVQEYVQKL